MQIDMWAKHADDFGVTVQRFDADEETWYTMCLGPLGNCAKLYLSAEQLCDIVQTSINNIPDWSFQKEGDDAPTCTAVEHEREFDSSLGSGIPMSTWICPECNMLLIDVIDRQRRVELINAHFSRGI